MSNTKQ